MVKILVLFTGSVITTHLVMEEVGIDDLLLKGFASLLLGVLMVVFLDGGTNARK